MIKKKNDRSNLEKKRFLFFELGILTVLALLLIVFEHGSEKGYDKTTICGIGDDNLIEEEMTPIVRDFKKAKPPLVPETIIIIEEDDPLFKESDFEFTVEIDADGIMPEFDFEDEEYVPDVFPFFALQNQPSYHGGGQNEFQRHLQKLVKYPLQAQQAGVGGKVTVEFVVDEKGKVTQIRIIKSPHPSLSEAVKLAFNQTDTWTPGEQQGRKVKVSYTLPVYFKLN